MTQPRPAAWIVDSLRRFDLPGLDTLTIPPGASSAQAWDLTRKATGITPEALAGHVARHLNLDLADLQAVTAQALQLVPERVARRHQIVPLRQTDRHFFAASSDPLNPEIERDLAFATGRTPVFEVAPPESIADALNERYGLSMSSLSLDLGEEVAEAVGVVEGMGPEAVDATEVEAAPVVRLTTIILRDALRHRASDIHLEPGRGEGVVRYRVDGVMRPHMKLPMVAMNRVISRIKVLGRLDISDRHRPQDGRARLVLEGRAVELRISTVPTRDSEKAVLRLLAQQGQQQLEEVGLLPEDVEGLRAMIRHRNGIVLVTGPTGSGKTTTLYAVIRELAGGDLNVMTVEDPIEYEISGINQIQVEPRRNVTFASALRAILRQDPDVILVGEIRDAETAKVALQASMTGHLVLATLHTNDAASAALRLADLGVERPDLAGALRGALAQRLVRQVCRECAVAVKDEPTEEERALTTHYGVAPVVRARGCPRCSGTGYAGRLPALELLPMNSEFSDRILRGESSTALARAAEAGGMRSLLASGLERVKRGETTLEEVRRVLGERIEAAPAAVAAAGRTAGAAPAAAEPATAQPVASGSPDDETGRLLVVDDDPVHRAVAKRLLEKQGFQVEEAEDGGQALQKVATSNPFQLVITDLSMPGMGGRDVVRCLRAMPKTRSVPIVVATSQDDEAAEIELMEAGADDYIRKPLDPNRFVARVRAALRRHRMARRLAA